MNREEYGYYPEAYGWLACVLVMYGLTGFEQLLYVGAVPGLSIGLYYYIMMIREARELVRTIR